MEVGRRLGRGGKHIQLVSQPIRLFLICSVSPPSHSAIAGKPCKNLRIYAQSRTASSLLHPEIGAP
jgi:hypothetical protein